MDNIPVYVISFNRLSVLKKTLEGLLRFVERKNIIIIDNASDYKPILDYYITLVESGITIFYNSKLKSANELNTIAPFIEKENARRKCEYYVITDPDISLELSNEDLFRVCKFFLNSMSDINIVGPMLKITDIPKTYIYREYAWKRHVEQFWHKIPQYIIYNKKRVFYQHALIDTTFGMLRSSTKFKRLHKGVLLYSPYEAQHLDWYISKENLTEDQKNYFQSTIKNNISHWNSLSTNKYKFEILKNEERQIYVVKDEKIEKYKLPNKSYYLAIRISFWKINKYLIMKCKNLFKRFFL